MNGKGTNRREFTFPRYSAIIYFKLKDCIFRVLNFRKHGNDSVSNHLVQTKLRIEKAAE